MESTKELFAEFTQRVDGKPAPDGVNATFQFDLSGDDPGTYQLVLKDGSAKIVEGQQEAANCTIQMDHADFKAMMKGELNGTAAFMSGKLKIQGDMGLAMRLESVLRTYE